jgi:mono/diheme cytochrome c family protein
MKNLLKVILFSLLTIGFFAGFANYGIPRIEPAAPPKEEKLDLSAMTMESFIAVGDRIFNGKGTCTLCHNAVGGRAPMLDRVAVLAGERLKDSRYQGSAKDAESYIYESMVEPSAYVVAGFGKAGSSDSVSPMPNAAAGSIGLSDAEMQAVIAYLQELSGVEISVEIPAGTDEEVEKEQAPVAAATPSAPLTKVDEIIAKHACGACHKVADQVGELGPNLTSIGASRDREYLRRAILDPNADVAEGFIPNMMPGTYANQLYASELEVLVDYLAGLK